MTTVVDSNVFIVLWDRDQSLNRAAQACLDFALKDGPLRIPAPVFAELLALPGRTEKFLDGFFSDAGIFVEWDLREPVWRTAAFAFQAYAQRRRKHAGGQPRRILADFLIGAYAQHQRARLLTIDHQLYRAAFPELQILKF
ncbi:MAG: PIN domain-containing protein [Acidobacteriota bacterium]